jgi:HEAT repeat protein
MDLQQIEASLNESDFQYRLEAIKALKSYPPEVAVPLLLGKLDDPEFLVRSFVAMGLGKQQTAEAFAGLLQLIKFDNTPNVRAEAANSLSLFGRVAASHLVFTFVQDDHWLVRRSILAALVELQCPEELFEVCTEGLGGDDVTVQMDGVDALATLADSSHHQAALATLLELVGSSCDRIRVRVAHALKRFEETQAKEALNLLRQDSHHQVVAATLENLL